LVYSSPAAGMGAETSKGLEDNYFGCCAARKNSDMQDCPQTPRNGDVEQTRRGFESSWKRTGATNNVEPSRVSSLMEEEQPSSINFTPVKTTHFSPERVKPPSVLPTTEAQSCTQVEPVLSAPRGTPRQSSKPTTPRSPLLQPTGMRVGIGAYFQKCSFDKQALEIRAMLPGGPMEHCGVIQVGDVLLEIDGEDMYGKGMSKVVPLLLGEERSKVRISFAKPSDFKRQAPASLEALDCLGNSKVEVVLLRGTQVLDD